MSQRATALIETHDVDAALLDLARHGRSVELAATDDSTGPETEAEFRTLVRELVDRGLVACTADDPRQYSTSFYDTLGDVGPALTASGIARLCDETGMNKRTVYCHILTDLSLDLDVTQ